MTIYYSKGSNGFYNNEIGTVPVPDDAVEISQSIYDSLLAGQSAGKVISPDKDGNPVLIDPLPPTQDELVAMANNKKAGLIAAATVAIGPLQDAADLGIATDEETSELKAWKTYRVILSRVDTTRTSDIVWPSPPLSS